MKKKLLFVLIFFLLLVVSLFIYRYIRDEYCLYGSVSNTCLYKNTPELPPGGAY